MKLLRKLKPFDRKSGNLNVVIDTPKGSRNKYAFDFKINGYKLKAVLPHGTVFPFDFGSIPGTIAADGDPLDVLVLMDEPVFIGCLVEARLLGVIEAEQTDAGKTERNDRLIAVAAESHTNGALKSLQKLDSKLIGEIEHFFGFLQRCSRQEIQADSTQGTSCGETTDQKSDKEAKLSVCASQRSIAVRPAQIIFHP